MLSDLNTAASELGLGPRPLDVAVANPEGGEGDDDDDDDENKEEGEVIMVSVKNGLSGQSSRSSLARFRFSAMSSVSSIFIRRVERENDEYHHCGYTAPLYRDVCP